MIRKVIKAVTCQVGFAVFANAHTANPTAQRENGYRRSLAFCQRTRSRQCIGTCGERVYFCCNSKIFLLLLRS